MTEDGNITEEKKNMKDSCWQQGNTEAAQHYFDHVSRFTELHAYDLIQALYPQIIKAKTILDIGCGPGTFALAYVRTFPKGILGQTLICSDLSPGMVQCAKNIMKERLPSKYATKFQFQVEDGSELNAVADDSIDVVVSVFGIFIIPDYMQTLEAIRRVLRQPSSDESDHNRHGGIFGTAVWTMTDHRRALKSEGFGPSFHELIEESLQELTTLSDKPDIEGNDGNTADDGNSTTKNNSMTLPPWKRWFDPERCRQMVVVDANYQASSYQVIRSYHSTIFQSPAALWDMIATNPMSKVKDAAPDRIAKVQVNLQNEFLTSSLDNNNDKSSETERETHTGPVIVGTASNLVLARPC
uniref:Methyltransferase domain-containing protein n=2 Tax=Pseudictyota dubia TaxID=2749911 RepID=A0A7R9W973_9STRA|mmetsp:Transcript_37993/g.70110  ORF Transcript_37993/g.70110 Transcript_37993/m.70110 type:complete len:355 (+) Transcript_37993:202-1266(+)|eukprot:CAMPEP_0197438456 /NCGR_PEP_ID=MMETSP1175-20131217/5458_1 /TAXON_ID=1003142 /ORGANISM="Triceratium dubium, Strain CCMP147" /LENGTH=354 /DNA_ID=CAMNT_0042968199 /DNA_START=285 /DNA_END=1349 /DNA_ORIENTATION=-